MVSSEIYPLRKLVDRLFRRRGLLMGSWVLWRGALCILSGSMGARDPQDYSQRRGRPDC